MSDWVTILSSMSSLLGIAGVFLLTLGFWKLHLLAPTHATRIGLIATLVHFGVWLIFGMLWVLTMIPGNFANLVSSFYQIPFMMEIFWGLGTLSSASSLLCLAWTLHRGIHPPQLEP